MYAVDETTKRHFIRQMRYFMDLTNIRNIDLADKLGVTQSTVSFWLSGRSMPSIDRVSQIANIFGCQPYDLIGTKASNTLTVSNMTPDEFTLIHSYRQSDEVTRQAIQRLLAYAEKFNESK